MSPTQNLSEIIQKYIIQNICEFLISSFLTGIKMNVTLLNKAALLSQLMISIAF